MTDKTPRLVLDAAARIDALLDSSSEGTLIMPISGFKPGDLAHTPAGRLVTVVWTEKLAARVRYDDGHTCILRQSVLRALPAPAETPSPSVTPVGAISDALMNSANALEKLYVETGDSNLMSVAYKIDAAVRDLQSIESAGIRR